MRIGEVTSLTEAARGRPKGAVGKIREVHHFVAQCYAKGMKPPAIAELVNRTPATVRNWLNSPANANLVVEYEKEHFLELANEAEYRAWIKRRFATLADEELLDRIITDPSQFSNRELIAGSADASDRTGLAKTNVQVQAVLNMGERLEEARAMKEKMLEARVEGNVVKLVRRF